MHKVCALFCRSDSVYRELLFDVWDAERDARQYPGPWPVVAHPPCRGWGSLRHFAKPDPGELELAFYAIDSVRRWGGVLEHPHGSSLWPVAGLPKSGSDAFGGFTVLVDQGWFGHFAPKPTWLYVVGMPRHHFPPMPIDDLRRRTGRTLAMLPADRERTPWLFAKFLIDVAARCHVWPGATVTRVDRERLPPPGAVRYTARGPAVTPAGGKPLRRAGGGGYVAPA